MKSVAILASLLLAACVQATDADPPTASSSDDAIVLPADATTTAWWEPGKMDVDNLWPLGQGITSAQVLYKKASDSSTGATFVAFVVWNGNRVGRIFRVHVGSDGGNFHDAVQAMIGARTFGVPGTNSSTGGNTTIGHGTPQPHPNVDGPITFDPSYLNVVKTHANTIRTAITDFVTFDPTATGVSVP